MVMKGRGRGAGKDACVYGKQGKRVGKRGGRKRGVHVYAEEEVKRRSSRPAVRAPYTQNKQTRDIWVDFD